MTARETRHALTLLYRQHNADMLRRALYYTRSMADAEDVVSSCWLSLMGHLPALMSLTEGTRRAYIMRSVHNAAIDSLRRSHRETPSELLPRHPDDAPRPDQQAEASDTVACLLAQLPPRQRDIASLKLSGCSTDEIACQLGISPASVRGLWFRALRRMRACAASLTGQGCES